MQQHDSAWPVRPAAQIRAARAAGVAALTAEIERQQQAAGASAAATREMRMDVARRVEARKREQAALQARARAVLADSRDVVAARQRPQAVLAHRNAWLRGKVADGLTARGIDVVAVLEDGAEASGLVVAEQPDVVVIEDLLPSLPGLELLARVRQFAPHALVAAHVANGLSVESFLDAGASAVFTRRIPPADVVEGVLGCLAGGDRPVVRR